MNKANLIVLLLVFLFVFSGPTLGLEIGIAEKHTKDVLGTLQAIEIGDQVFISLEEFSRTLSIPTRNNPAKKQITLSYKQNSITFSAFTPYIQINKSIYQMLNEVRYPNGEFYVPLQGLLDGFTASGINTVSYDPSTRTLFVVIRPPNIIRISNTADDGNVKLVLHTTESFDQDNIENKVEQDWVYITIRGGILDTDQNLGFEQIPQVFELVPAQISRNQARLSLHVAPNVTLESVQANPEKAEILISLKTLSTAPANVLTGLISEREKWKIDTIILDPGHGGKDPGCVGAGRLYEKNITLNIAQYIKTELQRRIDVNVLLTRDKDRFIPLKERTKIANQSGGKLFISIHVDANRVKSLRGHTVYFLGPAKTDAARQVAQFENSVIQLEESQKDYAGLSDAAFILAANLQNSYNKESQHLASIIDDEIKRESGSQSHGVRQAGFYVLYGASMPNILIETGFMTNTYDRQNLSTDYFQKILANAITEGIIQFKAHYESTML